MYPGIIAYVSQPVAPSANGFVYGFVSFDVSKYFFERWSCGVSLLPDCLFRFRLIKQGSRFFTNPSLPNMNPPFAFSMDSHTLILLQQMSVLLFGFGL